jgi:hypothetical protein
VTNGGQRLCPSVNTLQMNGIATNMPKTVAMVIDHLPSITSLAITCHQERYLQTHRSHGLTDQFCLQLGQAFTRLLQLRSVKVVGLVVQHPTPAWLHIASGLVTLEGLRHVEISGGWTWGPAPPTLQLVPHTHSSPTKLHQESIN